MANGDQGKKKWELEQCQSMTAKMNNLYETDYEVRPGDAEPADVLLVSKSGIYPKLPVQVVSIPLDFRHRDDKHSVEKIRRTLAELITAEGVRHYLVGIILSGEAEKRGIKHSLIEELSKIILKAISTGKNQ